jgi:hypothetical protein
VAVAVDREPFRFRPREVLDSSDSGTSLGGMLADEDDGFDVCCILLVVFCLSVFGTGSVISSSEDGISKTPKSAGCVAEVFADLFVTALKLSPDLLCGLGAARAGGIGCGAAFGFAAGRCTAFAFVLSSVVLCVT